jgi:Arc/MetJ family transcription regulator
MVLYMRTTLILPEGLVDEAREATGLSSKTETVVYALKEVVRRKKIADLKAMFGRVPIALDLDKVRGRHRIAAR